MEMPGMPRMSHMFMHDTFWNEHQVVIEFETDIPIFLKGRDPISAKQEIIKSLKLGNLYDYLVNSKYQFTLSSFNEEETLRPVQKDRPEETARPEEAASRVEPPIDDLQRPIGKYLFTSGEEGMFTTVIGFFNFQQPAAAGSIADISSVLESEDNENDEDDDKDEDDDNGKHRRHAKIPPVPQIVNFINTHLPEIKARGVPIMAASAVWVAGSTGVIPFDHKPQGCPVIPPIPVPASANCPGSPGLWPISVPGLSSDLQSRTGNGVTVFIFDTLPQPGEIGNAVGQAQSNNLLLSEVNSTVIPRSHYFKLPDLLEDPGPLLPATGKDIYGRLIGFDMPDHGLFVAGIVRDLAPGANIECMRVLSDHCVGDLATLTKALEIIHNRMLPQNPDTNYAQGDLYKKPVVINMSLVVPPSDEEAKKLKFKPQFTHQLRSHLLKPMHRMSELGAIFVASAGNEADPREGSKAMNPSGMRPFALYPAAFAYNVAPDPVPAVIPVGAVNGQREASSYSSYPGPKGIGTYGGEVPDPIPANPPAMPPTPGCYTQAINIDALIGIYCSESYPALSLDDCQSTYPAPNLNAWSYWVGTSFASPIITALVARYVEWKGFSLPPDANVTQDIISKLTTDEVLWTHLEPNDGSIAGPMVYAVQCPPEQSGETDMVVEEIDVEVVEVVIEENQ